MYTIKCFEYNDPSFMELCDYLEKNISRENQVINGGTLRFSNLTYSSDILIVAYDKDKPIGYNSLVIKDDGLIYIYQIAVKNEYKKQGVGSLMMKYAIDIANKLDKDIVGHVRSYNIASQSMFKSLGFNKVDSKSTMDNYFFELVLKRDNKKNL